MFLTAPSFQERCLSASEITLWCAVCAEILWTVRPVLDVRLLQADLREMLMLSEGILGRDSCCIKRGAVQHAQNLAHDAWQPEAEG